jgi:hypothetical protein
MNWRVEGIRKIDRKTRKIVIMYESVSSKTDTDLFKKA